MLFFWCLDLGFLFWDLLFSVFTSMSPRYFLFLTAFFHLFYFCMVVSSALQVPFCIIFRIFRNFRCLVSNFFSRNHDIEDFERLFRIFSKHISKILLVYNQIIEITIFSKNSKILKIKFLIFFFFFLIFVLFKSLRVPRVVVATEDLRINCSVHKNKIVGILKNIGI